jgi:hypothetical protein
LIVTMAFEKIANLFRRKVTKIAENCDHTYIDPGAMNLKILCPKLLSNNERPWLQFVYNVGPWRARCRVWRSDLN